MPGHQERRPPVGAEQLQRALVVGLRVDAKAVALACGNHQRIEGADGLRPRLTDLDAAAGGQPHVVAPLGLHPREEFLLVPLQIHHDRTPRLHRLRAGGPGRIGQPGMGGMLVLQPLRLELGVQSTSPS